MNIFYGCHFYSFTKHFGITPSLFVHLNNDCLLILIMLVYVCGIYVCACSYLQTVTWNTTRIQYVRQYLKTNQSQFDCSFSMSTQRVAFHSIRVEPLLPLYYVVNKIISIEILYPSGVWYLISNQLSHSPTSLCLYVPPKIPVDHLLLY